MPTSGKEKYTSEVTERLTFAARATGLGFWEVNLATNTVEWDGRCQELFGLSGDYYIPYDEAIKHIHPDDVAIVNDAVQRSLRGENDGVYDARYRTLGAGDSKLRWVHFSGRTYFNEKKEPIRFGGIAQDITASHSALMNAVTNFADEQARFLQVTRSAPTGLWLSDEAGNLTYLNETLVAWTGMSYTSLLGFGWANAIIEEDRVRAAQTFQAAVAARTHYDTQFRIKKANGRISWCRAAGDPYYNSDGIYAGYAGFCSDIEELVSQREALRQSEEKFRNIFEQAPMAIGVLRGQEMIVEDANDALLHVWGKPRAVIGLRLLEALPEIRDQAFPQLLERVYDSGEPYFGKAALATIEHEGQLKDAYFNFVYTPLRAGGAVTGIMILANEVTDQVLATQSLSESETALRGAIELAALGTWTIDLAARQIGYSERMYEWFGLEPDEVIPASIYAQVTEEDRPRVQSAMAKAIEPGSEGLFDEEYTVIHAITGRKRILRAKGRTIFGEGGNAIKIIGTAQDITVQRQLQLALEEEIRKRTEELDSSNEHLKNANEELNLLNAELYSSNQDLQQFAHVASHDLKEPLRKIRTFLSRLETDKGTTYSSQALTFIQKINTSAERMLAMIEGVLNYSAPNGDDQRLEIVPLNDILHEIGTDLEILIQQKQAVILCGLLPCVEGSRISLYQLFYNLIINSLKFAKANRPPQITVTSTTIQHNNLPFYEIEVTDNGIGFQQHDAENIFGSFIRLHPKDRYEGTGLGLSLCRKIVQRHHGSIKAEGMPDEGARFIILLPADSSNTTDKTGP